MNNKLTQYAFFPSHRPFNKSSVKYFILVVFLYRLVAIIQQNLKKSIVK